MTTPSVDGTVHERLRFLSSTVLRLDHASRGLRAEVAWPSPEARGVLSRIGAGGALAPEAVVQVAIGIGIPAESLTAGPESWRPVEDCFRRLIALRTQDERWRVIIAGGDKEKLASLSGPEAEDMNIAFWNSPRCYRGPWSRVTSRRRRGRWRGPVDATDLSDAEVIERCDHMISDLNESIGHFDGSIRDYLERLETHRGRPIKVRPFSFKELGGGECGIYIPRRTYDEIGFPLDAPHAAHIIFHEVGHMVFEHSSSRNPQESPLFRSMASITPDALAVYLGRSVYADHAEREAEAFATCLSAAASSDSKPNESGDSSETANLWMRTTFGG